MADFQQETSVGHNGAQNGTLHQENADMSNNLEARYMTHENHIWRQSKLLTHHFVSQNPQPSRRHLACAADARR